MRNCRSYENWLTSNSDLSVLFLLFSEHFETLGIVQTCLTVEKNGQRLKDRILIMKVAIR